MATDSAPPPTRERAPVIRIGTGGESLGERILKRQAPAWLISLGVHGVLFGVLVVVNLAVNPGGAASRDVGVEAQELQARIEEEEPKQNFENEEIGNDIDLPTNFDIKRIEDVSVSGPLKPDEPVGNNMGDGPPMTLPPPPGLGNDSAAQGGGVTADVLGPGALGAPGGLGGPPLIPGQGFKGRSGSTREVMLQQGGGNGASEACVARGLAWLAKQQRGDGSWEIDGSHKSRVAGTGIALLPFLAAGYTHKGAPPGAHNPHDKEKKGSKYPQQIEAGLRYLTSKQSRAGDFGSRNMYEHALATMAVCEAYGMTNDPRLRGPAQLAIDFIARAQHPAGGWRYEPGQAGDTSVTGWQIQALQSAHLAGLKVPKDVLGRATAYLDSCAGGKPLGSTYGYTGKAASPAMTAVGLLCRQYLGWGPKNPGLIGGVEELKKMPPRDVRRPGDETAFDVYYYYYATQVMHFYGGPEWHDLWNPRMRDWLLALQVTGGGANGGSWNPDASITGGAGGRLVTSCLCLLTLEVYYRHLPLYKREAAARRDLDGT